MYSPWGCKESDMMEQLSLSTGIPSPPLALLVVMLPKAHMTSLSRKPGSRGVTTPLWLYES